MYKSAQPSVRVRKLLVLPVLAQLIALSSKSSGLCCGTCVSLLASLAPSLQRYRVLYMLINEGFLPPSLSCGGATGLSLT